MRITSWKICRIVSLSLLSLSAGGIGFCWQVRHSEPASLARTERLSLDAVLPSQSFSEVENTKELLNALSIQYLDELRVRRGVGLMKSDDRNAAGSSAPGAQVSESIRELERGIHEFKGTEQELLFVQDLLWLLKQQGLYGRWIEVYLNALYNHPTNELIGRFAGQALLLGHAVGREQDVLNGFRHLTGIPLEFDAKPQFEAAVLQARMTNQFCGGRVAHLL